MRKHATPSTYVPGATLVRDPQTYAILYSNKGDPLWNMPKPIGVHETIQVVRVRATESGQMKIKKRKELTQFPVYRGLDASLARYYRAQVRRFKRKEKEKKNVAAAKD